MNPKGENTSRLENLKNCNIMEVRIKDNNGYVDADWTIEGGIMVVSPKVEFSPKDGDVLSSVFKGKYQGTFVFEEASECGEAIFHFAFDADGEFYKGNGGHYFGYVYDARPATKEEKKKLFDKLAEKGYEWDAEKKELLKLKWKPKNGETYFSPIFSNIDFLFSTCSNTYTGHFTDEMTIEKMRAFKTKDECQSFCDKLNQTIKEYEL